MCERPLIDAFKIGADVLRKIETSPLLTSARVIFYVRFSPITLDFFDAARILCGDGVYVTVRRPPVCPSVCPIVRQPLRRAVGIMGSVMLTAELTRLNTDLFLIALDHYFAPGRGGEVL